MIERSSISNNASDVGAQCSPRHACPLRGALLMQAHEGAQAAPVLVRGGWKIQSFACKAMQLGMHGYFIKKTGISGRFMQIFCGSARPVGA